MQSHPSSESYSQSGFGGRMGWGKRPALLIIDVCRAYWTEGSPLSLLGNPEAEAAPDSMRRLLKTARGSGVPVVWSEVQYTHPEMKDAGLFWHKSKGLSVWQKDDKRGLAEYVEGIVPLPEETVVVKKYASAFFGTTLATELQVLNIDTVVICGVSTSGCVRATTLDAMQSGFRPMVVGSACGDRTPQIHASNLFDLDAKYSDVVSEEDAILHLSQGWKVEG